MNKTALYEIDFINSKIILTKKFYKAAGTLNSNEYRILVQLRRDNPTFTVELREIKKKEGKQSYRNLTYENMRNYILVCEGEDSKALKDFDNVKALSQAQAGPYAYVKTWFLKQYGDAFKREEEVSAAKPELKLASNQ